MDISAEDEKLEKYMKDPKNWFKKEAQNALKMAPTRYSEFHIGGFVRQVDDLVKHVENHLAGLDAEIASLQVIIDDHLWIPRGFSETALASLREARARTEEHRKRLEAVREGFKALPREGAHGSTF